MKKTPPSALPIIKRLVRWHERQSALFTVRNLMKRLPQPGKKYPSYQWVVWAYISVVFGFLFFLIFTTI